MIYAKNSKSPDQYRGALTPALAAAGGAPSAGCSSATQRRESPALPMLKWPCFWTCFYFVLSGCVINVIHYLETRSFGDDSPYYIIPMRSYYDHSRFLCWCKSWDVFTCLMSIFWNKYDMKSYALVTPQKIDGCIWQWPWRALFLWPWVWRRGGGWGWWSVKGCVKVSRHPSTTSPSRSPST